MGQHKSIKWLFHHKVTRGTINYVCFQTPIHFKSKKQCRVYIQLTSDTLPTNVKSIVSGMKAPKQYDVGFLERGSQYLKG